MVTRVTRQTTKEPVKKAVAKKAVKPLDVFKPDYAGMLEGVERKFNLTGSMSVDAVKTSVVSTGLLQSDLILGGGLHSGRWYTIFGGEGSAKSTHISHLRVAAAEFNVPIVTDMDYEGSSAPEYIEGIMEYYSTLKNITELYGMKDNKGNWIIPPKVQYYSPNVAEDFFNSAKQLMQRLPNKEYLEERWWYSWEDDKLGKQASKGKHSEVMRKKYGRLLIEAPDGLPQAVFFLDSYPAMYPEKMDDSETGTGMAAVARAMSENVPKILSKLRPKAVTIVGVNQLRLRPAVMFQSPEYEPGGEALKFASSCRIRQAARSVPHGKGPIETENSVLFDDASDTYRYIHMKTIKNKTFTPYLEAWQRLWVDDGNGGAHGFDPVYDCYQYLKLTGQASGSMNRLKIPMISEKAIKWAEFKSLVICKGAQLKQACEAVGLKTNPRIKDKCFKQLRDGTAHSMFFEARKSTAEEDDE